MTVSYDDQNIRFWDIKTTNLIQSIDLDQVYEGNKQKQYREINFLTLKNDSIMVISFKSGILSVLQINQLKTSSQNQQSYQIQQQKCQEKKENIQNLGLEHIFEIKNIKSIQSKTVMLNLLLVPNQSLVASDVFGQISLWSIKKLKLKHYFYSQQIQSEVNGITYTDCLKLVNKNIFISTETIWHLTLWNIQKKYFIRRIYINSIPVFIINYPSNKNIFLIEEQFPKIISMWNILKCEACIDFKQHEGTYKSVACSQKNNFILGYKDGSIDIWQFDLKYRLLNEVSNIKSKENLAETIIFQNQQTLLTGGYDDLTQQGIVYVYSTKTN